MSSKSFVGFHDHGFWCVPNHLEVVVLAWAEQDRRSKGLALTARFRKWDEMVTGQVFRGGVGLYLDGDLADEPCRVEFHQLLADLLGRFDRENITSLDQLVDPARLVTLQPAKSVWPEDIEVLSSLALALVDGVLRTTAFNSPVFPNLIPCRNQVDTGEVSR